MAFGNIRKSYVIVGILAVAVMFGHDVLMEFGLGGSRLDAALFARAAVFTDEIAQSVSIGEAQHAVAQGLITEGDITPIGAVINGTHCGRASADDITLFDGTGVGLQDLAVASVAARLARERGLASQVTL